MEDKYGSETDPAGGEAGVTSGAQMSTCADLFHPDPPIPPLPIFPSWALLTRCIPEILTGVNLP